jgi:hypothetical protein
LETDKKKMNFIFNREEKIFLTGKTRRACASENRRTAISGNFFAATELQRLQLSP